MYNFKVSGLFRLLLQLLFFFVLWLFQFAQLDKRFWVCLEYIDKNTVFGILILQLITK